MSEYKTFKFNAAEYLKLAYDRNNAESIKTNLV